MHLSIVTTLFNSESYIQEFHRRTTKAAAALNSKYEVIYVDDGSPDKSLKLALDLAREDDHVKVVQLSRNFGHHAAISAALEAASGEFIFLIDSDLEESPEWLHEFINIMKSNDADLVFGVQRKRPGGVKQNTTGLFYRLFNILSETKIPKNACTARLMTREYRNALLHLQEKNLFMAGMFAWTGFHQVDLPVEKKLRDPSESSYTALHAFKLLVDAITSFSPLPLYLAFFLGLTISTIAGIFGTLMIIKKLLVPETVLSGYASLFTSIFFIGGLIILFLGIVGIYLSKIFVEVKDRPLYLVKRRFGFNKELRDEWS